MPYTKIIGSSHYTPSQHISNDQLAEILDTSDEWINSRTGISSRYITQDETTSDLAIQVAKQLLNSSGVSADQLGFVIVATITPDSLMPSVAAKVQAAIGANQAFAFDMAAACSGFVFGLGMADKLIASGLYQYGLVIGAETLSKALDWTDRSTAVLFGDGAGGVLLAASDRVHLHAENLRTDGSRSDKLTSGDYPLNSPYSQGPATSSAQLAMDGRAIFDFAVRDVPKNIQETLELAELKLDDIDYFLLHQANSRLLDKIARKLGADRSKFLQNMARFGNTSAASIPILLSESIQTGIIDPSRHPKLVLTGFGGGLTWGTIILTL